MTDARGVADWFFRRAFSVAEVAMFLVIPVYLPAWAIIPAMLFVRLICEAVRTILEQGR